MPESHAQIARRLIAKLPAGVFAHGARDAVTHHDYLLLERMLPGMHFASRKLGPDTWELVGTCKDGSIVIWTVGA